MQREVFFSRLSFKDFVISEAECDPRHVWIPSIIGARSMDQSNGVYLNVYQFSLDLAGLLRQAQTQKSPPGFHLAGFQDFIG